MTRKDFEAIAKSLTEEREFLMKSPQYEDAYRDAFDCAVWALADALGALNPRFDRSRFTEACGVIDL